MLDRRLNGWTIRRISLESEAGMGRHISPQAVHKRIEREMTKRKQPSSDAVRKQELDRLDDLEERMRALVERDPTAATDRLLKIADRRAKLLGLDAPLQVQQQQTVRYEIVGVDPSALT
jgi:hypothetical protein